MNKILMWVDADKQIDDMSFGEVDIDIVHRSKFEQVSIEPNVWVLDEQKSLIFLTLPKELT